MRGHTQTATAETGPVSGAEGADQLGALYIESLAAVSRELDSSYRDLHAEAARLRAELASIRRARHRELAEKERLLARLSSLLAVLPGGVAIVDAGDRVSDANPTALELLGEPLLGESWSAVARRNPELQGRGNAHRHLSVSSRPLGGDGERVVLITDTTEIQDLQEQLGRRHRLAALGEMAARLAHQIRTPLSSTALYLSQLQRDDLPGGDRERICGRLNERLAHMEGLIESMLSFVRGRRRELTPLLLRDVLATLEATVAPRLPGSARLAITPIDDTLRLEGCADDLVAALTNLVMNAVEMGGSAVQIDIWAGARDRNWLQLCVRDDGPGIADECLPRLFDPFFTTRARGTGLGLAVVAMTVSQHGGEVRARNRPTGGAEFLIDLPMLRAKAGSTSAPGATETREKP